MHGPDLRRIDLRKTKKRKLILSSGRLRRMASLGRDAAAASTASSPAVVEPVASSSNSISSSWLPSSLLQDNPYFSAGFGLMVFGTALAVGRRGATVLASQTQRRFLISLEIPSKDKAHPWFLQWMGAQAKAQSMRNAGLLPARKESIRDFLGLGKDLEGDKGKGKEEEHDYENDPLRSGNTRASPIRIFSHELAVETSSSELRSREQQQGSSSRSNDARFSLVPGPGTHWFRYKGCWMRVSD
jgi:chaperone BCS1